MWKYTDFHVVDQCDEAEAKAKSSGEDIHSCCSGGSCIGFAWEVSTYFLLLWICRWRVTQTLKVSKNGWVQACKEGVWAVPFAKSKLYQQAMRGRWVMVIPLGMVCSLILPRHQSNAICGNCYGSHFTDLLCCCCLSSVLEFILKSIHWWPWLR